MTSISQVIVFDLHGVVVRYDYYKIVSLLYQAPRKYNMILSLFYPQFWITFFKLLKKGTVPEECFMKLSKAVPRLQPYIDIGIRIANAQKPYQGTIAIIKELKTHGYKLFLFSNIGEQTLTQFQELYPEITALFDGMLPTHAADDYLKKPHQAAFEKYSQTFNHHFSQIIFVDNKKKNISGACALGIDGIFFKNPTLLRQEFIKRKIL